MSNRSINRVSAENANKEVQSQFFCVFRVFSGYRNAEKFFQRPSAPPTLIKARILHSVLRLAKYFQWECIRSLSCVLQFAACLNENAIGFIFSSHLFQSQRNIYSSYTLFSNYTQSIIDINTFNYLRI